MTRGVVHTALVALAAAAGCHADLPSEPTWFDDVQPIVAANCGRCHGAVPYDPTVAGFRLDRYVKNDAQSLDAFDYQQQILAQAVDLEAPAMPLDYQLTDRQREILRRWVDAGGPKGSRDNAIPEAALVAPADAMMTVDQELDLTYRTWDDDGDGLTVAIGAREKGIAGSGELLFAGLGGGLRTVTVDTGQLASKRTFEIYAVVDDGFSDDPAENQHEVPLLSEVSVDHGERGTAPTVVLLQPNGGNTLIGATTISWSATDPDAGDTLTIDLELMRVQSNGDETVVESIATGLPNSPPFAWDTSGIPADDGGIPIQYKVRVTATDAGARNTRSDSSDAPFTIAGTVVTDLTWDDVRPTFVTYCGDCHGEPARTPALEYFRLDEYDAADAGNGDLGVYEQRSLVYQKLVIAGAMPPAAEPQPSAAQVADIAEWISGGAPRGGGPSDGPPSFSWNTPNDAAISTTDASGNITLSWAASDPEGTTLTGTISVAAITAATDALAVCDATVTGWTAVADADVTAGSYAFTAPAEGYFCFRGQVTDEASLTTTAIARRPVKFRTMGPGPP